MLLDHTDRKIVSALPDCASRATSGKGILASSNIQHLDLAPGVMEYWSTGVLLRHPSLQYSVFSYLNISLNFLLQLSNSSLLGSLITTI